MMAMNPFIRDLLSEVGGLVTRIESVEAIPAGRACYVRVTADDGTSGVGESTFFAWPTAVSEIVKSFASYLVGKDPGDVEHHWLALYRAMSFRGMAVTGAISAVDQALWDLAGKRFEVPVFELLGGRVRRAVRAMRVVDTGTTEEVVDAARRAVDEEGYSALKILLFQAEHHQMRQAARIDDLVGRFAAIRETVGWGVDLGVELHRNMTAGDAVLLCGELERLRPLFVEDPIPPDSVVSLRAFVDKVNVPVAAGERNTTIWEFAEYLERPGVAYVRPDVGIAGGITHVKKICSLAEAFHAGILPHAVPSGPVAVAAHVQVGMCAPTWELQEHRPQDAPAWTDLVDAVIEVRDGYLVPPDRPGIGIALDDAGLAKHPPSPADLSHAPQREDGSIAIR
jgi:galactonate dehydratase